MSEINTNEFFGEELLRDYKAKEMSYYYTIKVISY